MKAFFLVLISTFILLAASAQTQDISEPNSDFYIGASAYMSLLPLPLNLSMDVLKFSGKAYNGVTFGITTFPFMENSYPDVGGHITYTRLAVKRKGYFETKFGLTYSKNFPDYWLDTNVLPVISIGYRFQNPDNKMFFRMAFSTGLIGFGLGVNLN